MKMTRQDWKDLVWWMAFVGAFLTLMLIFHLVGYWVGVYLNWLIS